jgi:coenzyme F420-0:L-glutamate ligase/coenzyme F420-1:gamma-L-glutamate ligase
VKQLALSSLEGMPLVQAGDDLAGLIVSAVRRSDLHPLDGDVFVVTQKIVSKAEGRHVDLGTVVPSDRAVLLAAEVGKDARLVELILSESTEVVRHRKAVLVTAHRLGHVMANAGIDQSNVGSEGADHVLLLPRDPDLSAQMLKARLDTEFGADVAVVISDSFGRPWRNGVVGVALGAAGIPALWDRIGAPDLFGRKMQMTEVALADQLASAACLLMGETNEGIPVVHVRGVRVMAEPLPAAALIRPKSMDMFR